MTKIAGSGSISQRHGSADPDPHQNVMDPEQHFLPCSFCWDLVYCHLLSYYEKHCPGYITSNFRRKNGHEYHNYYEYFGSGFDFGQLRIPGSILVKIVPTVPQKKKRSFMFYEVSGVLWVSVGAWITWISFRYVSA